MHGSEGAVLARYLFLVVNFGIPIKRDDEGQNIQC